MEWRKEDIESLEALEEVVRRREGFIKEFNPIISTLEAELPFLEGGYDLEKEINQAKIRHLKSLELFKLYEDIAESKKAATKFVENYSSLR